MKKQFLTLLIFSAIFTGITTLSSCGGGATQEPKKETEGEKKDSSAQSAYVCPMNCEGSASNEPGKCIVCGMDLVKNEKH